MFTGYVIPDRAGETAESAGGICPGPMCPEKLSEEENLPHNDHPA